MKLITWNCNMAFRKKAELLLVHKPDIVVIPECECPENLKFAKHIPTPKDMQWFGDNKHKGLGIFSYSKYRFRVMENYNPVYKTVVPVLVTGGKFEFILYAVWANNPNDPDGQYVEQVWKAIHYYDEHLSDHMSILAGDFNSNTIWDRKSREGNHSNVVKRLEEKGIVSCYHVKHKQVQGKEKHPTFYLYRHKDKPYHLDYCFVSAAMTKKIKSVEIGEFELWTKYSDHVPVMVSF